MGFINWFWLLTEYYITQNTHCWFSNKWNLHDKKEKESLQYNVTHGKKPTQKLSLSLRKGIFDIGSKSIS